MARARQNFRKVRLEATVRPTVGVAYRATRAEMRQMFNVSDRTLANWAELGLPVEKGEGGRPVYPFPDANVWAGCYMRKCREDRHGKGPSYLTVAEAHAHHLARQMKDDPTWFVIVPLDWSHPMREQMLQRAAGGLEPPGPEDEE